MSLRDWPILRQLCPNFFDTVHMAFVFGPRGNEALLFMSDGKTYGVGSNQSGCLGVGDDSARRQPTEVTSLNDKKIEGLACGGCFTDGAFTGIFMVAYLPNGDIYQWGAVPCKCAGSCYIATPVKLNINLNSKVTTVACGFLHCLLLCDDGKVFSWGANNFGQLGHSDNDKYYSSQGYNGCLTPCQVKDIIEGKPVIDICCGGKFSVVLLHDGKVVTWGCNQTGQLGIDSTLMNSSNPVEVTALNELEVIKIACGSCHVLALTKTNHLYGWGHNGYSQLNFSNPSDTNVSEYRLPVDFTEYFSQLRIIDIGASYACNLSVVQCESKEVIMVGRLASGKAISRPTDSQCQSIDQVFAFYASSNMMRKPMRHILKSKRRTVMQETIESEFDNPDNSDLTIVVDKCEIHVHQTILKMRSVYFRTMMTRWLDKDEKVITINGKSFSVIYTYLKYLYTDMLDVDLNLAVELFLLADEYGDDNFKSLCERSIKRDMKPDEVADIFSMTRKMKTCEELNEFCLDFIFKHVSEVINTAGFKRWDVDTMTDVFTDFVKKKGSCWNYVLCSS